MLARTIAASSLPATRRPALLAACLLAARAFHTARFVAPSRTATSVPTSTIRRADTTTHKYRPPQSSHAFVLPSWHCLHSLWHSGSCSRSFFTARPLETAPPPSKDVQQTAVEPRADTPIVLPSGQPKKLLDEHAEPAHPEAAKSDINKLINDQATAAMSFMSASAEKVASLASATAEEISKAAQAAKEAAAERATFAKIPTIEETSVHEGAPKDQQGESAASLPKMPSSAAVIRGTIFFDNMYPIRVHWLDPRYLAATDNHNSIIPKLFASAFGVHGFRLIGAIPRANEGGVFVHFEVDRQDKIRTPEDVTKALVTLLRAKPVHALLTPKAVRCHLVRGSPFLDNLTSKFPYNRLKIEIKGPATALSDLTLEQLYGEFSQFGKIFDMTLNNYEKDKPRSGVVQYVHMYSAVGARNCLHRLRLSVPLIVTSLPATIPPKTDDAAAKPEDGVMTKPPPPPTAEALMFLSYDSILKTSVITDFFVKHPRIMVPLIGLLFAAFTFLIFDPLRAFNIENYITHRFGLKQLYGRLPWPFNWLRQQANEIGQSSVFQMLRRGAGMGESERDAGIAHTWSSRQADEEKVRKWLNSNPDRLLFITGPRGAGRQSLVKKLTADRENVVMIDISHIIDRTDDEFVKGLAATVGFAPGFALITWLANIMDIFTPGASKASGSSTASSAQILKILECTSNACASIATKEHKRMKKLYQQRLAKMTPEEREALHAPPAPAVEELAEGAAGNASAAKSAIGSAPMNPEKADSGGFSKFATSMAAAVGLSAKPALPEPPNNAIPAEPKPVDGAVSAATGALGASTLAGTGQQPQAAASSSNSKPDPVNNNTEPLSKTPVEPTTATPGKAPLRLSEPAPHTQLSGEGALTEQQRNYHAYMKQQAAKKAQEVKAQKEAQAKLEKEEQDRADAGEPPLPKQAVSSHHHSHLGGLIEHEPDNLPLFVIDGFNAENASKHGNFLQVLVSWSAEMSAAGVARFVYLTDATLEESVAKSLPEVKLAEVLLSDATPEAAQEFLFSSLPASMRQAIPDSQTIQALQILGGRYNDLVTLVRGIENGSHPIETVEDIVVQSMNSVKSMLFTEDKTVKWSKVQMWEVINMIVGSSNGTVLYDDVLFNVFSGDDTPLKSLVRADLLRVEPALSAGGDRLKAGSPVMNEAFKRLMYQQPKLKPGLDLLVLKYKIGTKKPSAQLFSRPAQLCSAAAS
jgi:hypothetical protein